jgi:hypothetical protein
MAQRAVWLTAGISVKSEDWRSTPFGERCLSQRHKHLGANEDKGSPRTITPCFKGRDKVARLLRYRASTEKSSWSLNEWKTRLFNTTLADCKMRSPSRSNRAG